MERLPTLTPLAGPALCLAALLTGCVHKTGTKGTPAAEKTSAWPASVQQITSMMTPGANPPAATEIACMWQNRVSHLPDPTKNGAMSPGLAGKLFLFGAGAQQVPANGKLTIDLYDESNGKKGDAAKLTERWVFDKDTLKKLATVDEMFGRCYTVFLPWPSYRPDINQVRLMVKYEPVQGDTLYVPAETLTIDTSAPGSGPAWSQTATTTPLPAVPLPSATGMMNTPRAAVPTTPSPASGSMTGPGGLPPIAFVAGPK